MERKRLRPPVKIRPGPVARLVTFGPAPLLEGENETDYNDLLARIIAAVKPADVLEEMWARDVVDYEWHVLRLRRVKVLLINLAAQQGLLAVLQELLDYDSAKEVSEAWARRNPLAVKKVDKILADANLSLEYVMAEALAAKFDEIDRIDRMIMIAEGRRDAMLREISRHRATFGRALRVATEQAQDAEIIESSAEEDNA